MKKTFAFTQDMTSDIPLWVQLRQRIVQLIASGYFKPGDQLPTVRGLASDLAINYNTVNKAYMSLVTDGYLQSTVGRGVFVCENPIAETGDAAREVELLLDDFISTCRERGFSLTDIQFAVSHKILELKRSDRGDAGERPGVTIEGHFADTESASAKASS
ncbi:MAG: GntR family transcriptional regulator [Eggerthellaceae bacterium]|nr:GntR family transcriptional regulator [Eggerthellaceae bacterium]